VLGDASALIGCPMRCQATCAPVACAPSGAGHFQWRESVRFPTTLNAHLGLAGKRINFHGRVRRHAQAWHGVALLIEAFARMHTTAQHALAHRRGWSRAHDVQARVNELGLARPPLHRCGGCR